MQEPEALQSLDEITRKCVKRLGFQNLCTSENITADRANFRMIYEQESQRTKANNQLPAQLRETRQMMIDQLISATTSQIEQHQEPTKEVKTADMDQVSQLLEELRG
jgi:vacuolar-type H+-ATPase subunit E/Vma4